MILFFLQHPYEDPEGRIDLPASIRSQVDHWKRPVEFIYEKVLLPFYRTTVLYLFTTLFEKIIVLFGASINLLA